MFRRTNGWIGLGACLQLMIGTLLAWSGYQLLEKPVSDYQKVPHLILSAMIHADPQKWCYDVSAETWAAQVPAFSDFVQNELRQLVTQITISHASGILWVTYQANPHNECKLHFRKLSQGLEVSRERLSERPTIIKNSAGYALANPLTSEHIRRKPNLPLTEKLGTLPMSWDTLISLLIPETTSPFALTAQQTKTFHHLWKTNENNVSQPDDSTLTEDPEAFRKALTQSAYGALDPYPLYYERKDE